MKFVKKKRKFYSFLKNTLNSTNNMANLNKDFTNENSYMRHTNYRTIIYDLTQLTL